MKRLERNLNRLGVIIGITMLTVVVITMSSCASSNYYKGCDGKKKFITQMN